MCELWIHLDVIRSQDDPATEAVAQVDDGHAAAEPNDVRKGCSESHDQDLWEEARARCIYQWWPLTPRFKKTLKNSFISFLHFFPTLNWATRHLRCTSGRKWGNEWPRPTPGASRSPTGCHTSHTRTYSVRKERTRYTTVTLNDNDRSGDQLQINR